MKLICVDTRALLVTVTKKTVTIGVVLNVSGSSWYSHLNIIVRCKRDWRQVNLTASSKLASLLDAVKFTGKFT